MTLRDQLVELGIELAGRIGSQERAVVNARTATTALSRARVERDAVELFLDERFADTTVGDGEDGAARASS